MKFKALSVVSPSGDKIAELEKSIEVRSWAPTEFPLFDVAIVQNENYLTDDDQEDSNGFVVAIVDFIKIEPWKRDQQAAACSKKWSSGYLGWHIDNVRKILRPIKVVAKRKIYEIDINPGNT